jgi:glycosyltransferase involved in cell wall biosynthesis
MQLPRSKLVTIGIDAANLRSGGGITHLVELLRAARPSEYGVERVVVWGSSSTLSALEDQPWLERRTPAELNRGLLQRLIWQRFYLSQAAREAGCAILFVPGGSYTAQFHPVVTMSRNMLPFDMRELKRYGWTSMALRLLLLRVMQSRSFQKADGVIFLTTYARDAVTTVTGKLRGNISVIPHGFNQRFNLAPKLQRAIADYDDARPYRVLYVSIVDQYKHQWHVVEAVATLRKQGLPIALDLVGPAYPPALQRLNDAIARVDPVRHWVNYHGAIAFDTLHQKYAQADLGLFASSCENMPNILLETMASGLPIACSNRGPMRELLGDTGVYFDPEQPDDIVRALQVLIGSPQLRTDLARASYACAQQYSWQRCADETFGFLVTAVTQRMNPPLAT